MAGVAEFRQSRRWTHDANSAASDHRREVWDGIVDSLTDLISTAPPSIAIPAAQQYQRAFAAIEVAKLAEMKRAGATDRQTRNSAAAGGTRSKKAASSASKRADAVKENPELATRIHNGDIGDEQLDAIARASERSDGDAASDRDLFDQISNAPVDEAQRIATRWLERRDDSAAQTRYERQRERRGVSRGHDRTSGCEQLIIRGDREAIDGAQAFLERQAKGLYQADGGRDVPAADHPRTKMQRLFDAAIGALGDQTVQESAGQSRSGAPSPRAMFHIPITVDAQTGELIEAVAPDGSGLLPDAVIQRLACTSAVATTIFGTSGKTLWHGRAKRYATNDQWTALVARDGGCTLCRTDPSRCIAHHLTPFSSPNLGETNVDEMALVCDDCHHQIHDNGLTLYWQLGPPRPDGTPTWIWKTRPATRGETPADHRPNAA